MVPEKLGAGNGEGRGEGKRPDKGDSGFVPWLDNDATPVITKCMTYRQTMISNTLKRTMIKLIWFSEKCLNITSLIDLLFLHLSVFDRDGIGCEGGNGYYT